MRYSHLEEVDTLPTPLKFDLQFCIEFEPRLVNVLGLDFFEDLLFTGVSGSPLLKRIKSTIT